MMSYIPKGKNTGKKLELEGEPACDFQTVAHRIGGKLRRAVPPPFQPDSTLSFLFYILASMECIILLLKKFLSLKSSDWPNFLIYR